MWEIFQETVHVQNAPADPHSEPWWQVSIQSIYFVSVCFKNTQNFNSIFWWYSFVAICLHESTMVILFDVSNDDIITVVLVLGSSVNFAITLATTRSCCSTISCPTLTTGPSSVTTVNTPLLKRSSSSPIWPSNTQVSVAERLSQSNLFVTVYNVHLMNVKHYKNAESWMCVLQERSLSPAKCVTSRPSTGRTCVYMCSVATLRRLRIGPYLTLKSLWGGDADPSLLCSRSRS